MRNDANKEPIYPTPYVGRCVVRATPTAQALLMDTVMPYQGYRLPNGVVVAWSGQYDLTVYPVLGGDPDIGVVHAMHSSVPDAQAMAQAIYRHRA